MKPILSLINIKKEFKQDLVLNDVSFDIPKGTIFAFLGSNGAGKSTLLNIIMQILLPSSGKVLLNGLRVKKDKIGIVFQENTFDEDLTIYENMLIRGILYKIKKPALKTKIKEISNLLGLSDILNKKYKYCSGGQKRVAMIAKALVIDPEIIIMDEPTTALDIETRKRLWDFLKKLNKEKNLTIFFTTHYIEEAQNASNLAILNNGKIVFKGTYQKLINNFSKLNLIVNYNGLILKKQTSSVQNALAYLNSLDYQKINTFSLKNSNLEEIFIKLVNNAYINI
ncbi:MAG: ABC transporter ATP-binding protein [Firmicutes bacterium]|nr:ABC transporter ATP-binding protein [Bacillota bacterium]